MPKIFKQNDGFSAVEALLLLIIVALIGFVGWYVWNSKNTADQSYTNSSKAASTASTNTTAGWKTYSDSTVTFKYPASWSLKTTDNSSGSFLMLTAPTDTSIKLMDTGNQNITNPRLSVEIGFPAGDNSSRHCAGAGIGDSSCTVYAVLPVNVANATAPTHVVISDFDSISTPNHITVTDDTVVVDAKTFERGATLKGNLVFMDANVEYDSSAGKDSSDGSIANVSNFENTQSFKNLVNVFKSVTVKKFVNQSTAN